MDLSLLKNLSKARILVVGDVMLDRYWYGDTGRISPEAPVPVVKVSKFEDKAGGAANVAKNIARLDAKVGLLGLIGEDESGQILETILKGEKYVLYSLPFILLVGVTDYFIYKKNQLGKEFELYHFILGNPTCTHL